MRDVKEKLCYVALGNGTELKSTATSSDKEETYEHLDGNIITPAVRAVKERLYYIVLVFDTELKSTAESSDK